MNFNSTIYAQYLDKMIVSTKERKLSSWKCLPFGHIDFLIKKTLSKSAHFYQFSSNACLSVGIHGLVLLCLLSPLSCPLNPSQSRQIDVLPGSGSAQCFYLLKGSFPFHCRLVHAENGGLNKREVLIRTVGFHCFPQWRLPTCPGCTHLLSNSSWDRLKK